MLRAAPAGREGWASASLSLADVLGTAFGIGAGGAAIAAGTAHGWPLSAGVGVAFAIAATGGVALALVIRRLPTGIDSVS
jgi:NhaP-type Na+/H+ or K+/H+ antiporter